MHVCQILQRLPVALGGGTLKQFDGLAVIALHAPSLVVEYAQVAFGFGIALRCRTAVPIGRSRIIPFGSLALFQVRADSMLRFRVALLRGLHEPMKCLGGICADAVTTIMQPPSLELSLRVTPTRFNHEQFKRGPVILGG